METIADPFLMTKILPSRSILSILEYPSCRPRSRRFGYRLHQSLVLEYPVLEYPVSLSKFETSYANPCGQPSSSMVFPSVLSLPMFARASSRCFCHIRFVCLVCSAVFRAVYPSLIDRKRTRTAWQTLLLG